MSSLKNLISKLLTETITEEELLRLYDWLKNPKNQAILETYVQDYHDLNLATLRNNIDAAYHKVMGKIEDKEKPIRKLIPNWTKYAAVIMVLLGLGFMFQQGFFSTRTPLIPGEEPITLELENGVIKTIDPGTINDVRDTEGNLIGKQNKSQLTYQGVNVSEKLVYNTLRVPYGKRFGVELSDGTQVYLNSGSTLKYPITFLNGMDREVSVTGEAYFDVTTDMEHPFIVNAEALNIAVLGTQFNVASYVEDTLTDVVLVEGTVGMYNEGEVVDDAILLAPGFKGSFDKLKKEVTREIVNTTIYTSWRDGGLVFRNTPFKNILKKLERHYNINIVLNNEEVGEELFSASFTDKTINDVLSYFDDIKQIEYTIKENTVYID